MNTAFNHAPQSLSHKQLVETIAALSTGLVEMTGWAEGLDPTVEHTMSVAEYADLLVKAGKKIVQRDRIRLGQVAGA